MAAINLLSPTAPMPFGPDKGLPIWALSITTREWLGKQELTIACGHTLEDAWDMFMHEGQYAILQRPAMEGQRTHLVAIYKSYSQAAEEVNKLNNEYIYHIAQKVSIEVKLQPQKSF